MGWHGRESVDSFTFNHIGHFAKASHAFARALILGGVTHRFPDLRFAFLEGGVGWACNLVTDLVGHWERRRREAMEAQTRPTNLDRQELARLFRAVRRARCTRRRPRRSSAASPSPSPSRRPRS